MGYVNFERFLPKNQHTQRKLLNFENWVNGGLRSFQKSAKKLELKSWLNFDTIIVFY